MISDNLSVLLTKTDKKKNKKKYSTDIVTDNLSVIFMYIAQYMNTTNINR